MNRFVLRGARRFYLRHPWQLALALLGIALGVAVYVGVDLANESARRAFEQSTELARGRTTHRLLPIGEPISETSYADLVRAGLATQAAPIVELEALVIGAGRAVHTVLGVDPIEEAGIREFTSFGTADGGALMRMMTEPGSVIVPEGLASEAGLGVGDKLRLGLRGREVEALVVGTSAAQSGGDPPIVTDIATAQAWSERPGTLDRIDLRLDAAQAASLAAEPPAGTTLVAAANDNDTLDEMMRAFRTNLSALGLLALAVGMFLIYATMSFAIVQRRPEIGILRALGLARRRLLGSFMAEALALGVIGTLGGLALGHWLAKGLVAMVLQTVGDLSFSRAVAVAAPSLWTYVSGAVLGIAATLVAAFAPALEAARDTTDQAVGRGALERRAKARSRRAAWLAVPLAAAAAVLLAAESRSLAIAFTGLALVLAAGALLTPAALLLTMRLIEPLARRGVGPTAVLAVRGVGASLSRTGVAAAALAVAVATVIGVGIMIGSFRTSLEAWLETTLTADLYVALGADGVTLDEVTIDGLRADPRIEGLSLSRVIRLPTAFGRLGLRAASAGPEGWGLDVIAGGTAPLDAGRDVVAVTEPLAYRHGLAPGNRVELPTPAGPHGFEIAAVYRDYNAGGAALTMPLEAFRRHWRDDGLTGIGVHLARGADERAVTADLERRLGAAGAVRSTSAIERVTMVIFDRTFEITEVLRWLAGLIAFFGILSAALAIQLERTRELAVLRSLGMTPREIGGQVLAQTSLLGLGAGLAAIPIGATLAALLVNVINRRSFGWTMELDLAAGPVAAGLLMACAAALLAGVYPAWRSAHLPIEAALRDE